MSIETPDSSSGTPGKQPYTDRFDESPENRFPKISGYVVSLTLALFSINAIAVFVEPDLDLPVQILSLFWMGIVFTQYGLPAIFGIFARCPIMMRILAILVYGGILSFPMVFRFGIEFSVEMSFGLVAAILYPCGVVVGAQIPLWVNRSYFEWQILHREESITKATTGGVSTMITATSIVAGLFGMSQLIWFLTPSSMIMANPGAILFPAMAFGLLIGFFVLVPVLMVVLPEQPRWRLAMVFFIFYLSLPIVLAGFSGLIAAPEYWLAMFASWGMFPLWLGLCLYFLRRLGFRLVNRKDRLAFSSGESAALEESFGKPSKHPLDD